MKLKGAWIWMFAVLQLVSASLFAYPDKDFPQPANPPRLVNDFAGMMDETATRNLEQKLVDYDNTSSVQIAVVSIRSLGGYEISVYASELFSRWQIGQKGKDNGVLIIASLEDRKMFIATGRGVNRVLTDAVCDQIIREQMVPYFKSGNYAQGFSSAADAIIAVTKGEYKNDKKPAAREREGGGPPVFLIFIAIVVVIIILIAGNNGRGGGGGGGNYMSRRGGDFITGAILGSLLSGGRSSGGWGGGGGFGGGVGGGFGGFGGFGGGSTDGGGAGGSW